ncbi:MAG: cellulase family glycosylhydrolase [Spirochaetales bacterium]|nr:cellulase family glycosylhydrolase [Spirochaetales bacterium]
MIKKNTIIFVVTALLMCLPVIVNSETITLDYSFDGAGQKSLILDTSNAFYINCWNTTSVTVNGVDKTNTYSSFDVCGTYVIEYSSSVGYSHIEIKSTGNPCSGGGGGDPTPDPTDVPTAVSTAAPTVAPTAVPTQAPVSGPVSEYGRLMVNGSHIVSASNNIVQLKGFSSHGLQWFPYVTGGNGTLENLVECFGIQVLRAAMYAYEWDLGRSQWAGYLGVHPNLYNDQVRPLIQDAIDNGIYIIVDWHIHWNPSDPNNQHWTPDPHTSEAKTFFSMVAQEFGYYDNIIYEVINEPGNGISWSQVKTHASEVISAIRQHDPDNLILVPSPNWAQEPVTPSNDPILDAVDADNDGNTSEKAPNVAYTIHFYAMSHNFRSNADQAMANGIALFATEWGVSDYSGDGTIDISEGGPADQWTDWMEANSISWTAWSFCNKGESSAILEPYTYDNIENEARWPTNEVMSGYPMQSGPWGDSVIKPAGEWLRDKIGGSVSVPTAAPTDAATTVPTAAPTTAPTTVPVNGDAVLEVELESLSGQSLFSPLIITPDTAASGGQAIQWPGNGSDCTTETSDTATGQVLITFTLSQSANLQFSIQVNFGDTGGNDSFFYKMDSNSWNTVNNVSTSGYQIITPATFNSLAAGSHTFRILRREDGALLDKVILTASAGTISSDASNPTPAPTAAPTPESGGGVGESPTNPLVISTSQTNTVVDLSNGYCWVAFPQIISGSQYANNGGQFSVRVENESGTILQTTGLAWSIGGVSGVNLIKIVRLDGYSNFGFTWW